jgi:hypothetical protein
MRIYFFATALLVFFFSGTSSYSQSFSFRLEWAQPVTEPVLQKKILYFEGASFGNKERLPVFTTDLPLMQGETANVSLSEEVYEPLGYDNIIGSSDLIKKDISVTSAITYEKKKPSLHVSLIPLRY